MTAHIRYECAESACDGCGYCAGGGLVSCVRCHGTEGTLPTECPGRPMSDREVNAVYRRALDFRAGTWVAR